VEGVTNSVEGTRQREQGSGGGSPLVRVSTQFTNESNPYSDKVTDVFSTELGIQLSFVKTLEFRGVQTHPRYATDILPTKDIKYVNRYYLANNYCILKSSS
jgi:hypothetical protein